tara:strand:- start:482 stop:613 length:132 start_codon:yes stop_codon:yes gene_type:complete
MKGKEIDGESNQLLLAFLISLPFTIGLFIIKYVIDLMIKTNKK